MNADPTDRPLDSALLQLRIALANALTVTDAIRALRPRDHHLLPNLYAELSTLQRVVGRARAVLRRHIPPRGEDTLWPEPDIGPLRPRKP
jgi:hypothetical protein